MMDDVGALAARRILVTGGSGFIGSHVVRALRAGGADVTVADLMPDPDTPMTSPPVDLRDPGAAEAVVRPGTDAIVHLAATTSVLASVDRPAETFANNVIVTSALLEQARCRGVRAFVFASTNAVVGAARRLPIDEQTPLAPLTPYGATKAAAEMMLSAYNAMYPLRCAWLRLTNVYGPGMAQKDSVVARLLRAAAGGTPFDVYGHGHQLRDYIHVTDVVAALRLAVETEVSGPVVIGSGRSTSVLDLTAMVREVTGVDLALGHVGAKSGEMAKVVVDISRAKALGWRPAIALGAGLKQLWESWPVGADGPSRTRAGATLVPSTAGDGGR